VESGDPHTQCIAYRKTILYNGDTIIYAFADELFVAVFFQKKKNGKKERKKSGEIRNSLDETT